MKATCVISLLASFCLLTYGFQCNPDCNAYKKDDPLGENRLWFPDTLDNPLTFQASDAILSYQTTSEAKVVYEFQTECYDTASYETLKYLIRLNDMGDSLKFDFRGESILSVTFFQNGKYESKKYNFLNHNNSNSDIEFRRNFKIHGKIYDYTILLKSFMPDGQVFDSLYLARKNGIVGFKYLNKKYWIN